MNNKNDALTQSPGTRWQGKAPWFAAALLLALLAGCTLRLHHLTKSSLWADELFTLAIAHYHPLIPEAGQPWYRHINVRAIGDGDSFWTAKAAEQSPPLFDLLVKLSVQSLGPTELGARLPALIAGCLLLAFYAWQAWRERDPWLQKVTAWALLLLAMYPALVLYAKEGRAYSLGAALVGIGALLWLQRWAAPHRAWWPPGWPEICCYALAFLTHYNAAAMVAILLLPDVVQAVRFRSRSAALRFAGLAAMVLPWLALHAQTILDSAGGNAGWGQQFDALRETVRGALEVLHRPWLVFCGGLVALLAGWHLQHAPLARLLASRKVLLVALLLLGILLDVALSGRMAAKAGMAHPRYYLFMVPLAAIVIAILLAELPTKPLQFAAVAAVVVMAAPGARKPTWMGNEDFRGMARYAARGVDAKTAILYPWEPNRDMYRTYLERFLGGDRRTQMVAVSFNEQANKVCARLAGKDHVAVLGHVSGRDRTNHVHAACGTQWPHRYQQDFEQGYGEHWYRHPPSVVPGKQP